MTRTAPCELLPLLYDRSDTCSPWPPPPCSLPPVTVPPGAPCSRLGPPDHDVLGGRDQLPAREHRVRTADGIGLHVSEYGDPEAALTVVLTHGWTLSGRLWQGVVGPLAQTARVLVYDHRAHGRSDRAPADACSLAQLGSDLGAVIDALAPTGDLVLTGHSMGGMTIMHLAEQRPPAGA